MFDYFDELRKLIETARQEVFFVDAYLDADFVRYLPQIATSASIRLLGVPARMSTLLPAVDLSATQYGRKVQVRQSANLPGRYVFIDRGECY